MWHKCGPVTVTLFVMVSVSDSTETMTTVVVVMICQVRFLEAAVAVVVPHPLAVDALQDCGQRRRRVHY